MVFLRQRDALENEAPDGGIDHLLQPQPPASGRRAGSVISHGARAMRRTPLAVINRVAEVVSPEKFRRRSSKQAAAPASPARTAPGNAPLALLARLAEAVSPVKLTKRPAPTPTLRLDGLDALDASATASARTPSPRHKAPSAIASERQAPTPARRPASQLGEEARTRPHLTTCPMHHHHITSYLSLVTPRGEIPSIHMHAHACTHTPQVRPMPPSTPRGGCVRQRDQQAIRQGHGQGIRPMPMQGVRRGQPMDQTGMAKSGPVTSCPVTPIQAKSSQVKSSQVKSIQAQTLQAQATHAQASCTTRARACMHAHM